MPLEKLSFLHTLFLENEEQTSEKKYRAMFVDYPHAKIETNPGKKKWPKIRHKAVMHPALQLLHRINRELLLHCIH